MREVVIVSGARTAVGSFGGSLKGVRVVDLGALVIKEAIKRAGLRPVISPEIKGCRPCAFGEFDQTEINKKYYDYDSALKPVYFDEVIMGMGLMAGQGQSPGRQSAIYAGLPEETNAVTINKVCGSGIKAIAIAAQAIKAGDADVMIAGGMENMSNALYGLPDARWGYRMNMPFGQIMDLMVYDGLLEIFNGYHMGMTAEKIAETYKISRHEQDELAALSHERALACQPYRSRGRRDCPRCHPQKKGLPMEFKVDERPMETSLEKMSKLRPCV